MDYMFFGCIQLTSLNVSNFNLENTKNINSMFGSCHNLESIDLFHNTGKIRDMGLLFSHCYNLSSIDLSKFNTSNVKYMDKMFYSCYSLTSIDLSNFNTNKLISINNMFSNCNNLRILNFSSFRDSYKNFYNLFLLNSTISCKIIISENLTQNIKNIIPSHWDIEEL